MAPPKADSESAHMEHGPASRMSFDWALRTLRSLSIAAACFAFSACAPSDRAAQIRFELDHASEPLNLQFYVHDLTLLSDQGDAHSVALDTIAPWQSSRVALIRLASEDSASKRSVIDAHVPDASYTGVRFAVG